MSAYRVDMGWPNRYDPRLPVVRDRDKKAAFRVDHMTNSDTSLSPVPRKRRGVVWAAVIVLAGAVAAGIWWQGQQSGATGGDAAKQGRPAEGAGAPPGPPVTVANPIMTTASRR